VYINAIRFVATSWSTELPKGSFKDRGFYKTCDSTLMAVLFSLIPSQKKFLTKKLKKKVIVLHLADAMESTRNKLASFGLRWWQRIIVRGLHKHCIAAGFIGSRKTILIPRIQLRPSHPSIHFKLQKTNSDRNCVYYGNQCLKVRPLICWNIHHSLLFPHGQLCMAFFLSYLFENVAVTNNEGNRQRIQNDSSIKSSILYR
jgi:hypothetical protein